MIKTCNTGKKKCNPTQSNDDKHQMKYGRKVEEDARASQQNQENANAPSNNI